MKRLKLPMMHAMWCSLCLLVLATTSAQAGDRPFKKVPSFDFADGSYLDNGINPDNILDRLVGQDERSVKDRSRDRDFADVRILETTGGFDHKGHVLYYTVNGKAMLDTFTDDEAGREAFEIANEFRAFIFPKADGLPLSPAPPNRRQDNVFDTRHGYFSNDPLGLWLLVFVSYTDKAFVTEEGLDALFVLAVKNGLNLDGTPVIKTVDDLEDLEEAGFVQFRSRALDGSQGFPWVI